jgi:hypothetical protein
MQNYRIPKFYVLVARIEFDTNEICDLCSGNIYSRLFPAAQINQAGLSPQRKSFGSVAMMGRLREIFECKSLFGCDFDSFQIVFKVLMPKYTVCLKMRGLP